MLPSRIFFDSFFDDEPRKMNKMMKCDIYEKDNKYNIELDIPGAKKEDINMELEDGYLTVTYSKKEDITDNDKKYIRRERHSYESASRQFYVGNVTESDIKASFKDGILSISVPKEDENKETKKIINID